MLRVVVFLSFIYLIHKEKNLTDVLNSFVHLNLRLAVHHTIGYYTHWAFTNHMCGNILDLISVTLSCQSARLVDAWNICLSLALESYSL